MRLANFVVWQIITPEPREARDFTSDEDAPLPLVIVHWQTLAVLPSSKNSVSFYL